jgi:hypothetical protein
VNQDDDDVGSGKDVAWQEPVQRLYGYWATNPADDSGLPWPVASVEPDHAFLGRAQAVQKSACDTRIYKGSTRSRLTGHILGSHEWQYLDERAAALHRWPGDYVDHYLGAGVAPDPDFAALVERVFLERDLARQPAMLAPTPEAALRTTGIAGTLTMRSLRK